MDIREIRIDAFRCWRRVHVVALETDLNVIHLEDGGQPGDFSRFLHGLLYGFSPLPQGATLGGSITFHTPDDRWILKRRQLSDGRRQWQLSGRESWKTSPGETLDHIRGYISAHTAARLFIPISSGNSFSDRWRALAQDDVAAAWLRQYQACSDGWLRAVSSAKLASHRKVIADLAEQRSALLASARHLLGLLKQSHVAEAHGKSEWTLTAERTLDRLRLQIKQLEARLRRAVRITQTITVLRHAARNVLSRGRPDAGAASNYLRQLTNNAFVAVTCDEDRQVRLKTAEGQWKSPTEWDDETVLGQAWLAVQLAASEELAAPTRPLPLVLFADDILAAFVDLTGCLRILRQAARRGLQVFLVTSQRQQADRLANQGLPVVNIARRMEFSPHVPDGIQPTTSAASPEPTDFARNDGSPVTSVTYEIAPTASTPRMAESTRDTAELTRETPGPRQRKPGSRQSFLAAEWSGYSNANGTETEENSRSDQDLATERFPHERPAGSPHSLPEDETSRAPDTNLQYAQRIPCPACATPTQNTPSVNGSSSRSVARDDEPLVINDSENEEDELPDWWPD